MTVQTKTTSIGRRIIRAAFAVGVAHILFKVIGVIQSIAAGCYLDDRTFDTVYAFAFEGCIFSLFLIGEESIGPAFLPIFMRELDTKDESDAWNFANVILSVQFLVLIAVMALIMFLPDGVIRFVTFWNMSDHPEKYALARDSLVWLAPSLICLSLGTTTYMLLNGYKRFFLAALGDATWKLCTLVAIVVGMGLFGFGYRCVIFGLLLGSAGKLATHLLGLRHELHLIRPSFSLSNPAVKRMAWLIAPLICGILLAKARDIFNNVTVLSYLDTDGLIKANSFGRKLHQTIGWLVPYALSIAMFPFFCELVDKGDKKKFAEVLTGSARMLTSIFLPFALVCVVLARPTSFLLLHGGKFGAETVEWTAVSMSCYVLVLPAYALEYLLMQAFFANRRMISVTIVGAIFSAMSIAISYIGIIVYGARGIAALMVIAVGYTVSRTAKAATLVALLKRSLPIFPAIPTLIFLLRVTVVSIMTAASSKIACTVFETLVSPAPDKMILLAKLASAGLATAVTFVLASKLMRVEEPFQMLTWAIERVKAKKAG